MEAVTIDEITNLKDALERMRQELVRVDGLLHNERIVSDRLQEALREQASASETVVLGWGESLPRDVILGLMAQAGRARAALGEQP